MKKITLPKVLTANGQISSPTSNTKLSDKFGTTLSIVLLLASSGHAQTPLAAPGSVISANQMTSEQKAQQLTPFQLNILKIQFLEYVTTVSTINPQALMSSNQQGGSNEAPKIDPTLIKDLSQESTTPQETRLLNKWAEDIDAGQLETTVRSLLAQAKNSRTPVATQLQSLNHDQTEYAIGTLIKSIEAIVKLRGLTKDSKGTVYSEWQNLSSMMITKIKDPQKDFSESKWLQTEQAEILIDGPASFARRDRFMDNALESINIMTWSIYDDVTGKELVDLLLKKKRDNPRLNIRVLVDGQVAAMPGHGAELARLEAQGNPAGKGLSPAKSTPIKIIRWKSKLHTYVGQHRKMLIVDNEHLIAGGINFGDVYSHKNTNSDIPKWRDTDIYLKGDAAREGNKLFAEIWNEQVVEQGKTADWKMAAPATPKPAIPVSEKYGFKVKIINNDPRTHREGSTIMLTVLKAIREATRQIDIENAYIILFPGLKNEIQAALNRGVKVRILTNSSESVDEPAVSIPILRSVRDLADLVGRSGASAHSTSQSGPDHSGAAAEVYIRKGTTLHSKIMMVDSLHTYVMSYNLHPRSERLEGEMAIVVENADFTRGMHEQFTIDTQPDRATRIRSSSEVLIKNDPTALPVLRIFFDTL
jgi:cardiolipin synthase